MRKVLLGVLTLAAALSVSLPAALARTEAPQAPEAVPGITSRTITIGGTFPLSGFASQYAPIPRGMEAYFKYINARKDPKTGQRGIYGRQIVWKYYDDAYNPAQTVQATRKLDGLVERTATCSAGSGTPPPPRAASAAALPAPALYDPDQISIPTAKKTPYLARKILKGNRSRMATTAGASTYEALPICR